MAPTQSRPGFKRYKKLFLSMVMVYTTEAVFSNLWKGKMMALTKKHFITVFNTAGMLALMASATTAFASDDVHKKQAEIQSMCESTLATLYKAKPELKAHIAKSAGYGCFSNFGITFLLGGGGGYGLVHDNASGKMTYMNVGQASVGLEVGIKNFREILVFKDKKTLNDFITSGWEPTGNAGATAKAGDSGGSIEKAGTGQDNLEIYPMTETGLALGASGGGRKYWKSKELNKGK